MQMATYNPYLQDPDRADSALIRLFSAAAIAALVSLSLFYLMQRLIGEEGVFVGPEIYDAPMIPFVSTRDPPPPTRRPPPTQPPTAEIPPDIPTQPVSGAPGDGIHLPVPRPPVENGGPVTGIGMMTDGALTTLLAVQPIYPRRALVVGTSGYVIVEFSVDKLGTVENAHVVGSEPSAVFDDAALAAINKFRFRPYVKNGKPMAVSGVQKLFRFEIEGK